ncbi:hypothetical protein [Gulosibacter sp. 10]|uniref:hypothetical protein n=1 Tax=Gulosibacter sp. 10 TaxID=1255570 RepID=UPI001595B5AB|nr:hypothetical protein [Gulosibacter sp. 10]
MRLQPERPIELRAVRAEHEDPEIPEGITDRDLDNKARMELKTLSKENASFVAKHLAMSSMLIDSDPELAHQHALSASRRGGRIAMVRETLAITAYTIGDYALALRELRTYRRISGKDDQLALMVDCERGLGRPDRALELGRTADRDALPAAQRVQLAIAMSGARLDQEQPELALAELEIPQLDRTRAFEYSPALFAAYATVLEDLGQTAEAAQWHSAARRAEAALEAVSHNEFETIEIVSEELESDEPEQEERESEEREPEEREQTALEAEPRTADEPVESVDAVEPSESVEPAESSASVQPTESVEDSAAAVDSADDGDDAAVAAETGTAGSPAAPSAPVDLEDLPTGAELESEIQAEYEELIAQIEQEADAEAAAATAGDTAKTVAAGSGVAGSGVAGSDSVESDAVESDSVESDSVESDAAGSDPVESDAAGSDAAEQDLPAEQELPASQDIEVELIDIEPKPEPESAPEQAAKSAAEGTVEGGSEDSEAASKKTGKREESDEDGDDEQLSLFDI